MCMSVACAKHDITLSVKPCQDSLNFMKFMHFTMCYHGLIGASLFVVALLTLGKFREHREWLKIT